MYVRRKRHAHSLFFATWVGLASCFLPAPPPGALVSRPLQRTDGLCTARGGLLGRSSLRMQQKVEQETEQKAAAVGRVELTQKFRSMSNRDVRQVFERFDKKSSSKKAGFIRPEELSEALRTLGVIFTEGQLRSILDDMTWEGETGIDVQAFERAVERMLVSGNPRLGDELGVKGREEGVMRRLEGVVIRSDREKEQSRQFRRTYFSTSKDWQQFRSSYRIIDNLETIFRSTVVSGLWLEISMVFLSAVITVVYNEYMEFHFPTLPLLSLPVLPFTLSSPALGLLLVFRTSGAYARYNEALQTYALSISHCLDLTRQGLVFFENRADAEELGRRSLVFAKLLKRHLRGGGDEEQNVTEDLKDLVGEKETARIMAAKNRPLQALMDMAKVVDRSKIDIGTVRPYFEPNFSALTRNIGTCERILKTPMPMAYTRHTGRFLALYMLLIPLALWGELDANWAIVPASVVMSVFLFGIEELGIQIEEPFSILPMDSMCDSMQATLAELVRIEATTEESEYDYLPPIGEDAKPLSSLPMQRSWEQQNQVEQDSTSSEGNPG